MQAEPLRPASRPWLGQNHPIGSRLTWLGNLGLDGIIDDGRSPGCRDRLILFPTTAADTDGADDRSIAPQRDAACEDHDPPVIGVLNSIELLARLAVLRELGRRNI